MKTKNLFISGLIGLFASCSSQNCKIEGTVENAKDGDTLYLARMSDGNFTPTDTIILHQGKFTLQEKCDSTIIASFFFYDQESNEVYSNIFFMEKGNIQLNIGPEGRVSGTENNDIYQEITDSIYALHERMSNIYARQAPSDTAEYSPDEKTEQELVALEQQSNWFVTESALGQQALAELLIVLGNIQLDKRGGYALRRRPRDAALRIDPCLSDITVVKHDLAVALKDLILVLEHVGRQGVVEHAAADHGVVTIGADAVGDLFVGHVPAHASRRRRIGLGHRVGDNGLLVHVGHRYKGLGVLERQIHLVALRVAGWQTEV